MAKERRPPVDEVILSVAFGRKESLTGPRLGVTIGDLLDRYPIVERQPPFEMPIEYPLGVRSARGAGIRFEMLQGVNYPDPRFWLITRDGTTLLQIQPNFFGLNWRRKDRDQKYPGFDSLRRDFTNLIREVDGRVQAQQDGELEARQVELTYVNILRQGDLWRDYSDTHRIVAIQIEGLDDYEQIGLTYSKALVSPDDGFLGRLHVSVQPAVDAEVGDPVLNLSITARSTLMHKVPLEEVFEFLNVAHEAITNDFTSLVTDEALNFWGLT